MARQSPDRHNAGEAGSGFDGEDEVGAADHLDDDAADDSAGQRSQETVALWTELRVDPVEIALPTGTGYTLRAYRPSDQISMSEVERDEDDADMFPAHPLRRDRDAEDDLDGEDDDDLDGDLLDDEEEAAAVEEEEDEEAAGEVEEVPVFLGHQGRLYLFRTPESLVEFVRSGAEHDLTQLDTWPQLVERIRAEHVVPAEDDTYELDLVVDNLRGGHDVWDPELVISAGEIARDLAYALRVKPILAALAPGSPLDDLDEALRASVSGGLGGLLARRRLRKIGAQQATLGWRTIIGKISGVVVWRE